MGVARVRCASGRQKKKLILLTGYLGYSGSMGNISVRLGCMFPVQCATTRCCCILFQVYKEL